MDTGAPKNNVGKIVGTIVGIAVVLLGLLIWGGVSLFRGTSETIAAAKAPAGQFLDALQAHKFQAAYKMLTPQIQATTTAASLQDIQELLEKRRGAMTGHSDPSNWFVSSNNGVTTVQLTYTEQFQHGSAPVTLTMINTPSGWRVYGYHYQL